MSKKINTGKEFESIVAAIHKQFNKEATITEDEKIKGKSGKLRQIDVAIRTSVLGYKVFIVVECKDYQKKIGIGKVDELIGKIEDVGADKGILISNSGFTEDAILRANNDNRIQLSSVIDIKNNKIKAKLGIPFLAHFDSVKSLQLTFSGTGNIVVGWSLNAEEQEKFRKLWNEGKLSIQPGEHIYEDVIRDDHDGKLIVTMNYVVERTSYFKKVQLEDSVGIYNHSDDSYMTKRMVTEVIKITDFDETWEVVSGELPKATIEIFGQTFFAEPK